MFNALSGILSLKKVDGICLDTHGIEWDIAVPSRSIDSFGNIGDKVRVFTWLHHYEDGMRLFGFATQEERLVFLELMKVEGIGPKQALRVLSGIGAQALETALNNEDLKVLQTIPGVGPKLAQKMLLALKGKLVLTEAAPGKARTSGLASELTDIARALVDMGYDRKTVEATLIELNKDPSLPSDDKREKELFRRALLALAGG